MIKPRVSHSTTRFARSLVGTGDRLLDTPLTIKPISSTAFSRGAVAHVFAAHR
jgi:hypothetical protein